MANHRRRRPGRVIGNHCMLCQMERIMGNSRKMWGSDFRHHDTRSERKAKIAEERQAWGL